jgi:hypothetical protein
MDLMCPHCQRRVSVSDDQAGQVASCPLCTKQFMAPSLPPAPMPVKPPAPPIDTYAVGPAPILPPVEAAPGFAPTRIEPMPPPPPPPPPLPPGEYTRSFSLSLSPGWLAFVPAACVGAIFLLSFFPSWHHGVSLYGLSFTSEYGQANFLFYSILMFLCLLAVGPILLFDQGWLFTPPQLAPLMPWKNLALGAILGFCFLLLFFDYARGHIAVDRNPIELAMAFAIRLQFIASLASFGMFWLHWRKRKNLPLPKLECRW